MKKITILIIAILISNFTVFSESKVDDYLDAESSNSYNEDNYVSVAPDSIKLGVFYIQFADWETNIHARGGIGAIAGGDTVFYVYKDYTDQIMSFGTYKTADFYDNQSEPLSPDGRIIYGSSRDYWDEVSYSQFKYSAGSQIINPYYIDDGDTLLQWLVAPYDREHYSSQGMGSSLSQLYSTCISQAISNSWISSSSDFDCYGILYAGASDSGLWGVKSGNHFMSPERDSDDNDALRKLFGIQTFCHEFGHILTLNDKYGPVGGNADGLGDFTLMGTWWSTQLEHPWECPPHISCYEKELLGWLTYTEITGDLSQQSIPEVETNPFALKYTIPNTSTEYFFIENRQPKGFDFTFQNKATQEGGGILVYHKAPALFPNEEGIMIVEADGDSDLVDNWGDTGSIYDFFGGAGNVTSLTDFTDPCDRTYNGNFSRFALFNISSSDSVMTFDAYTNAWAGTVSSNITWEDEDVYIYDDLTIDNNVVVESDVDIYVAEGATLTCNSGSQIKFASGKRLHVYGSIETNGTSSYPVIFTRDDPYSSSTTYWYGVYVHEDGDFDLDYTEIYGANYGLRADYCTGTINHSTFEENYYGFYGYYSDNTTLQNSTFDDNYFGSRFLYSDDITLTNNSFSDNSSRGLYLTRAYGDLTYNTFSSNGYCGIYITSISSPSACISATEFYDYDHIEVNNTISNNSQYGVYILYSAYADFGSYLDIGTDVFGGFNYFNRGSSTYDIRNRNTSYTIPAEVNWWSSMSNYGNVDTNPTASSLGFSMSKPTTLNPLQKLLTESRQLERDSLYSEALKILDQIFQEGPDDPIIYPAICSVSRIFNRIGTRKDLLKKLDDLYFKYQNFLVGIAARDYSVTVLAKQRNFKEALNRSREVVAQYIDKEGLEENAAWALYEQGLISLELENQNHRIGKTLGISSKNTFITILEKFPDSDAAEDVREQFPDLQSYKSDTILPEKFQISLAYPNPFNPTTTFSYELPEESYVKISVFDISGRLVETLIHQNQNAGIYNVQWNASSYPSGVYLYQIKAGNFNQVKKCLLVK